MPFFINLPQLLNLWVQVVVLFFSGVCHGDELGYLFHSAFTADRKLDPDEESLKMLTRMVMMWTNFAKSGYRHYFNHHPHLHHILPTNAHKT
jgi:carboxylesterase type B